MAAGVAGPKFYENMLAVLSIDPQSLPPRENRANWLQLRTILERKFASRTQADWIAAFDGVDACVTPVLLSRKPWNTGIKGKGRICECRRRTPARAIGTLL